MDEKIAKEHLCENSEDFRDLFDQHQMYEARLKQFTRLAYLSSQDQFKQIELKKRKLVLKDQMQLMINDYCSQAVRN